MGRQSTQQEPLHEFFAVTQSGSLYRVADEYWGEYDLPLVERLVPVANDKPFRLQNGHTVGITRDSGIVLYNRTKPVTAEFVNTIHWGGHTTPVVGLFLNRGTAEVCLQTQQGHGQPWDPQWLLWTRDVLSKIGKNHPLFVISDGLPFDW
jgi:hypothetical protein